MKKLVCLIMIVTLSLGTTVMAAETARENRINIVRAITTRAPKMKVTKNNIMSTKRVIRIEWNTTKKVTGYELQQATDKRFKNIAGKNKLEPEYNSMTYHIGGSTGIYCYEAHKDYYMRVRAVFGKHKGRWSGAVKATGDLSK